ncbi:MAG: hypothetical protein AB2421_01865 [Thermotaleaceae bacterium]
MKSGIVVFNWTIIFQLLNTGLWIAIIYFVFKLAIKLPRRIKKSEEKIERMERMLEEICKKLD